MLRIAIHARVPTSDKDRDTESQPWELRQFVTNKATEGWAPAGEYVDQASGKRVKLPGLLAERNPQCSSTLNFTAASYGDPRDAMRGRLRVESILLRRSRAESRPRACSHGRECTQ